MNTSAPRFYRRRFLVKRRLQMHFALTTSILLLFSTLGMWLITYWAFTNFLAEGGGITVDTIEYLGKMRYIVLAFIVIDVIAIFGMTLYFSNHVAGPIYRIEKALAHYLDKGEFHPVTFRKHDLLQETADLFNQAFEKRSKG